MLCLCAAFTAACGQRGEVVAAADKLLESLGRGNYVAFRRLATTRLAKVFSRERFMLLSAALRQLGALQKKRVVETGVRAGGGYTGSFELRFSDYPTVVRLELTIINGRVVSLSLAGPSLARALRIARQGTIVEQIRFLDAKGRSRASFGAGEGITVELIVAGLTARAGRIHAIASARVFAAGQLIVFKRRLLDARGLQGKNKRARRLRGVLRLPAGRFRVVVNGRDIYGKQSFGVVRPLLVRPQTKASEGSRVP